MLDEDRAIEVGINQLREQNQVPLKIFTAAVVDELAEAMIRQYGTVFTASFFSTTVTQILSLGPQIEMTNSGHVQ